VRTWPPCSDQRRPIIECKQKIHNLDPPDEQTIGEALTAVKPRSQYKRIHFARLVLPMATWRRYVSVPEHRVSTLCLSETARDRRYRSRSDLLMMSADETRKKVC